MRFVVGLLLVSCATVPPPAPVAPPAPSAPARQNPSPMVETTRQHGRVERSEPAGRRFTIDDVLPKPVEVLITPAATGAGRGDLVIHFHGSGWLPMQAAEATGRPLIIAAVNLGAGSSRYAVPFDDEGVFARLRQRIAAESLPIDRVFLTGFSAGYGAIRSILRQTPDSIDGVLLLDGLHAGYIPDEKPVAEGGVVDSASLEPFLRYAQQAVAGEKRMVITHSEIFPGTFASTTETTDSLLAALGLQRTPVLKWGPLGMQQLSEAGSGKLEVLGFAGNTAPDHVDHLHAYREFLDLLLKGAPRHPEPAKRGEGSQNASRGGAEARSQKPPGSPRLRVNAFRPFAVYIPPDMAQNYPEEAVLRDGRRVLLRPFTANDTEALYDFFHRLPVNYKRFAWDNVDNRALIESWGRSIEYSKAFPLLALDGTRVVADATLHRREGGPLRLVGRIKWMIDPEFRGVGLGTILVKDLVNVARERGLRHVSSMLITDLEADAVKTLEGLGFKGMVQPGYGTDPDGNQHDMTKLILKL